MILLHGLNSGEELACQIRQRFHVRFHHGFLVANEGIAFFELFVFGAKTNQDGTEILMKPKLYIGRQERFCARK